MNICICLSQLLEEPQRMHWSGCYEVKQSSERGVRLIIGKTEKQMQETDNGRAAGQYHSSPECISHRLLIVEYCIFEFIFRKQLKGN